MNHSGKVCAKHTGAAFMLNMLNCALAASHSANSLGQNRGKEIRPGISLRFEYSNHSLRRMSVRADSGLGHRTGPYP